MSDRNQDAIAIVTSALHMHADMTDDSRLDAFSRDTIAVTRELSPRELTTLVMVLGMMNASLIDLAASLGDSSPEELLRWIALQHGTEKD